jgi:hypothetical protein
MFTVVCGVLFFLLLVVFVYYNNALNKQEKSCTVKLQEKDNKLVEKDISYNQQKEYYENNINQQKEYYENNINQQKTLCDNEKNIINTKLNSIYNAIDTLLENLGNNQRLSSDIETLRQFRAQAQALSSIIPSQSSVEELKRKLDNIQSNINNKITERQNDTIDPISQEMSNIFNLILSMFIEKQCNSINQKAVIRTEDTEYDRPLEPDTIECIYTGGNLCYGRTINSIINSDKYNFEEWQPVFKSTNGETIDRRNLCRFENNRCIPRNDIIGRVRKSNYRTLDETNFEIMISDIERMRDTLTPAEHKSSAEEFLNTPAMFLKPNDDVTQNMTDIITAYMRGFVEFSQIGLPVKVNHNKLIQHLRDTKEKFCNPDTPKDYKVYVTNFVDNMYDSYMKIN